jgi:F-type H+-transporting ATPase subunit b
MPIHHEAITAGEEPDEMNITTTIFNKAQAVKAAHIMRLCGLSVALFASKAAHAAGGEATGLPQLDFTTWPTQIFWLVVTFTLGYILMARLVVPNIGAVLEERRDRISADIEAAKSADQDAKDMQAKYEAELAEARAKAAEAAKQALDTAKAENEKAEAALSAKLAKKTKTAETKLAKAREEALAGVDEAAQDAVSDIVKQVANVSVTAAEAKKSVAAAAKAMEA